MQREPVSSWSDRAAARQDFAPFAAADLAHLRSAAPMPFDAVVSRRALVCELDRQALLAFLSSAPSASLRWMRSIALRLDDDRRRLLAIMTSDLTAQVAFVLLEHAEPDAAGQPAVQLSHQVIAQLIGARRQSVSRVLADLRERGLVDLAYRRVALRDVEGLRDVAGPSLAARPP